MNEELASRSSELEQDAMGSWPDDGARFVAFLTQLTSETYAVLAGLRASAQLAAIKEAHADLYEKKRVLAERECFYAANSPGPRRCSLLRLLERGRNYLASKTQDLEDQIATWQLQETVEFEEQEIAYHMVPGLLRNIPDHVKRVALGEAHFQKMLELQPKVVALWESIYDLTADLGYPSYGAAYAEWKGLDLDALSVFARQALNATHGAYHRCLSKYAQRLAGISANDVSRFDLPWILRGLSYDHFFPHDRIVQIIHKTSSGLGMNIEALTNIHLDLEPREKKTSRAFCAAVRVPEEIYLVAKPSGGHRDYEEILHEMGHALHAGYTDPRLPWELRFISDEAVAETYAYLMAGLLRSEEYLIRTVEMTPEDAHEFVAYANFIELYMIRRYCAKTLYEVDLHGKGELSRSSDLYSAYMQEALGFAVPGELGLLDMDTGLGALQYLLAWFLEASGRTHLQLRYGPTWFESPEAGAFLRTLWARGATDTPQSLLATWGECSIGTDALLASLGL